ncbi:MAG: rane-flanked domain [Lacunisphaera sp.]|nr:rane-flanked domain [Lacunisphaera sp.]
MLEGARSWLLRVLRVPHDPTPPFGAPGSVRVFRAGKNFYNLRLARWGLGQLVGTIGLIFSLVFFWWFRGEVEAGRQAVQDNVPVAPAARAPVAPPPVVKPAPAVPLTAAEKVAARDRRQRLIRVNFFKSVASKTAPWALILLEIFEAAGVLLFLAQIPLSLAVVRLEFELHWYIVTDRSLRIRTGILRLRESTMSFANLQQVEVKQGPLQRLLGLADVHVQSAGGAGDHNPHSGQMGDSLHTGIFHGVDNADEVRDLILARLRQFRQAGLGDHDDPNLHVEAAPPPVAAIPADALAAAHELLAEARAMRAALS